MAPITTEEKIKTATEIVDAVLPHGEPSEKEKIAGKAIDAAGKVAEIALPQFKDEIKLAEELKPFAFHAGHAIAHAFQHLLGHIFKHGKK